LPPVELLLVGGQAVGGACGEEVELGAHRLVALDVQLAVGRVVALLHLVHHRVPHERRLVVPGLARALVVLATEVEVRLPRRVVATEEFGDFLTVGGQSRCLEELLVVAQRLGPDIRAETDHAAVGVGALLELPVDPVVLDVRGAVLVEVHELVGHLHDRAEPALLDGHDVAQSGTGRELGERVDACVGAPVDVGRLDGHSGVLLFVFGVQIVVAELPERGDGQIDGVVGTGRLVASASAAARGNDGQGCYAGEGCDFPESREFHDHSFVCVGATYADRRESAL
jgi:hypothetical protein